MPPIFHLHSARVLSRAALAETLVVQQPVSLGASVAFIAMTCQHLTIFVCFYSAPCSPPHIVDDKLKHTEAKDMPRIMKVICGRGNQVKPV